MKNIIYIIIFTLTSCTITKKIPITYKTINELTLFYKQNFIDDFLIVNSYNSLKELYKMDRVSIPKNLIFDIDGYEIEHFNDKFCANHTLEFLKSYNSNSNIKKSNFTIQEYLVYLKSANNKIKVNEIKNSKKIKIFVNTATYANKFKANEEAFKIFKEYGDKYDVYIINLDYINEWEDK